MKSIPTAIPDVLVIGPRVFGDAWGFFFESFNKKAFAQATASVGLSRATTAAVDNAARMAARPEPTYKSRKVVQTNGATSLPQVSVNEKMGLSMGTSPPFESMNLTIAVAATSVANRDEFKEALK
jgi:hypothetical protein